MATAIAVGYAAVRMVTELVAVVLAVIADKRADGLFVFDVGGRNVAYQGLLGAAATLLIVATVGAWLLARSGDK